VPGLLLAAGAFGLADLGMHTEVWDGSTFRISCGTLLSGPPHRAYVMIEVPGGQAPSGRSCDSLQDSRGAEVAAVAGLAVLALGGATWLWWRDTPLRAVRNQEPGASDS